MPPLKQKVAPLFTCAALAVVATVTYSPSVAQAAGHNNLKILEIMIQGPYVFVAFENLASTHCGTLPHFSLGSIESATTRAMLSIAQSALLSGKLVNVWASDELPPDRCLGNQQKLDWISIH